MFCVKCGKEIRNGGNFCTSCGYKVSDDINPSADIGVSFKPNNNTITKRKVMIGSVIVLPIIAIIIIIVFLSSRIPNPPSENEILSDISSDITTQYIDNDFQYLDIVSVELEKRQTNKDDKNDRAYIQVNMANSRFSFTGYYECYYIYYDDGGWLLNNYYEYQSRLIVPISGISDAAISELSTNLKDTYQEVSVTSHITSENNNRDTIVFSVYDIGDYLEKKGDIRFEFIFDGNMWIQEQSINEVSSSLIAGITQSEIDYCELELQSRYSNVSFNSRQTNLDSSTDIIIFDVSSHYGYMRESGTVTFYYTFNHSTNISSWILNDEVVDINEIWDIVGTWEGDGIYTWSNIGWSVWEDIEFKVHIDILSFNEESISFSVSYAPYDDRVGDYWISSFESSSLARQDDGSLHTRAHRYLNNETVFDLRIYPSALWIRRGEYVDHIYLEKVG